MVKRKERTYLDNKTPERTHPMLKQWASADAMATPGHAARWGHAGQTGPGVGGPPDTGGLGLKKLELRSWRPRERRDPENSVSVERSRKTAGLAFEEPTEAYHLLRLWMGVSCLHEDPA